MMIPVWTIISTEEYVRYVTKAVGYVEDDSDSAISVGGQVSTPPARLPW